ncbi:MAG: class I SAM-dependent methyltransferase [Anaerolineaceae bacterium]|jgi:ubiquinone/menaquinone biosynthesis C-methylase UbiE
MTTDRNSDNVQQFEQWSSSYDHTLLQYFIGYIHRAVLDVASEVKNGRAPESILDVGCGTGRLLRRAGARWPAAKLLGVDPAEGMATIARQLTPGATFFVGGAESLALPDGTVDVALSTISFHHWNDQVAGVREVARVLRPGGCFCLADIRMPAGLSRVIHHHGPNDPRVMAEFFIQAGLQVAVQKFFLGRFFLVTAGIKP